MPVYTRRCSSVDSEAAWGAIHGHRVQPQRPAHSLVKIMKILLRSCFPLLLIQEEQLSVKGEIMCIW